MHRPLLLVAALLVVGSASARGAGPPASPPGMKALSDERTITRWAYPQSRGAIFSRPASSARLVARLHWLTEDRLPEVYLALASWTDGRGATWIQVRVPKRPNGITGWVRRESLRTLHPVTEAIEINRSTLTLELTRSGAPVWSTRIGIGAAGTQTPRGRFYIREKFRVKGAPVYGPYALGTSAYAPHLTDWPGGGVVGLHGTNAPGRIPGRPSHGCIRLRNADIARLYRLAPRGTPVWVHD
jgi:hypothetical protein